MHRYKADLGQRLRETKRLFGRKALAVDVHTHSNFSDGTGTVEENRECAMNVGLDFFFATDHRSLGQKRIVKRWNNVSWGQEPGIGNHHLGILHGRRLFKPKMDGLRADFDRACAMGEFVFIPHPVGWYWCVWYADDLVESLWTLPNAFAIEVINGANKVVRAYDPFDAKAIQVWDRLLCDGRKVTALGGSDAHSPDDIGSVWTGVLQARCTADAIIRTLKQGRCFASEASLMAFSVDGKPMGSTITSTAGSTITLRYRVADAGGIASVRIVSGGRVVNEVRAHGETVVELEAARKVSRKPTYYRLESTATDGRRAFSTPIYVAPTPR